MWKKPQKISDFEAISGVLHITRRGLFSYQQSTPQEWGFGTSVPPDLLGFYYLYPNVLQLNLTSNIVESYRAIRSNITRAILTILVIAFGLTALVGVLTAVDSLKYWFAESYSGMGSNTFQIVNYTSGIRRGGPHQPRSANPPIDFKQALEFKEEFGIYAPVSIQSVGTETAKASYQGKDTPNNLQLLGADEHFLLTNQFELEYGRQLTNVDVQLLRNVVVIGKDVADALFPNQNPVGNRLQIDKKSYEIVGSLKHKGNITLMGGDKTLVIPITTLNKDVPNSGRSYSLHVYVEDVEMIEQYSLEGILLMRKIRALQPRDAENFGVIKIEMYIDDLMENLRYLRLAAIFISMVTLISASIGLMNIMLVSVKERTREIGVRKAMGATQSDIRGQFLTEAIIITQMGGLLGILFGIFAGNITSLFTQTDFYFPWGWVILGFTLCIIVGVVSGYYPARKAASVDPIESLRYE